MNENQKSPENASTDANKNPNKPRAEHQENEKVSFLSMVQSVVAGIFGVQSDKNREKDFTKGDASQFITLGIAATVILMITMILVVRSVLESAGH